MITGVGIDYPETFQDLDEQFSSDDVSLDYIVKLRWDVVPSHVEMERLKLVAKP